MDGSDMIERNPYLRSRGLRVPKHPELTVGRTRAALKEGTYERKECDAVMRVVNEGDTVLELGAGMGYMSTLLSVKKKVAKVLSFEANPQMIPYIKSMHDANGVENAEVRNQLLSPEAGEAVPFYVRKNFLASSMDGEIDKDQIVGEDLIERAVLGDVLAELNPNVLVCDIEGAEADLLPAGDWSGLRCAVIELHPQWIGQKGVQAVFDAMQKGGLTFFPKASEGKVVTFMKNW